MLNAPDICCREGKSVVGTKSYLLLGNIHSLTGTLPFGEEALQQAYSLEEIEHVPLAEQPGNNANGGTRFRGDHGRIVHTVNGIILLEDCLSTVAIDSDAQTVWLRC